MSLAMEEDRVRFDVNVQAINRARLWMSSQLLAPARRVERGAVGA